MFQLSVRNLHIAPTMQVVAALFAVTLTILASIPPFVSYLYNAMFKCGFSALNLSGQATRASITRIVLR